MYDMLENAIDLTMEDETQERQVDPDVLIVDEREVSKWMIIRFAHLWWFSSRLIEMQMF